jgi:hypothetical protein
VRSPDPQVPRSSPRRDSTPGGAPVRKSPKAISRSLSTSIAHELTNLRLSRLAHSLSSTGLGTQRFRRALVGRRFEAAGIAIRGDQSRNIGNVHVAGCELSRAHVDHLPDELRERLPHPDHDYRIEDAVREPEEDARLRYPYRVSDHYAGDVHDRCDHVLERVAVSNRNRRMSVLEKGALG